MKPINKPVKRTSMAKKLIELVKSKKIEDLLAQIKEIKMIVNH